MQSPKSIQHRANRATVIAVVGLLVIALSASANPPSGRAVGGHDIRNPDYVGTFGGSSRALLKITKRTKKGVPKKGMFQAKRMLLSCEGGEERMYAPTPRVVKFTSGTKFSGFDYSLQSTGYQLVFAVEGRLEDEGRSVRGRALVLDNPTSAPGGIYCTTIGWRGWHAERVKP